MLLGMNISSFTLIHALIALLGIASGLVVMYGLLTTNRLDRLITFLLVTTATTNLSRLLFPLKGVSPEIVIGVLSLIVLGFAVIGRYALNPNGPCGPIYIVAAAVALYFNVFAFVVQSSERVPHLRGLAPARKEAPFALVQLLALLVFTIATGFALKRFRPGLTLSGVVARRRLAGRA